MAKENLFNILAGEIVDARFLDLFCGSGAIGLEALSRRAKEVVLVENAKAAITATRHNIAKTKLPAQLLELPAAKAIEKLAADGRVFDIIFLDPPYETNLLAETFKLLARTNLLGSGGLLIAETDSKIPPPDTPESLELIDTRIYGRTCFLFYTKL